MLYEINKQSSFRLLLVGATDNIKKELKGLEVEICPWDENTEADLIRLMDIGIMPLHDGPWEKGKCGYKLIQYMASGVPVIASDVGVNREIIETSESGLLVKEQSSWTSAILKLINSPDLRAQFGKAGREAIEKNYSIQSQLPKISKILNSFSV
jgi:glycosyltransferase involved in cell wall biosynthesis